MYDLQLREIWREFTAQSAAFIFLVIYYFFEYVRPQSVWPSIDILPFSFLALMLTAIFLFADNTRTSTPNPASKFFILFYVVIFISILGAIYPSESRKGIDLIVNWFILYFLTIKLVNSEKRLFLFLFFYFLYNIKMSQFGFRSWALNGFGFTSWGVTGAPGWFRNSGEFGIQMCIFFPMALSIYFTFRDRWSKIKQAIYLFVPVSAFGSIIASSSRGALIGVLGGLIWMVAKSKYRFKALLGFLVISLLAYKLLPEESMARFSEMGEDQTSLQRMMYWEHALEIIREHPILGLGYNNWLQYYYDHYRDTIIVSHVEGVHNIFLQIGAEMGILGFIVYLMMILSMFYLNSKTRKAVPDNKFLFNMAHAFDVALIGFLISGSFITVAFYPYMWVHMAMVVSLYGIAIRQKKSQHAGNKMNQSA